jgi:hypothetical protein
MLKEERLFVWNLVEEESGCSGAGADGSVEPWRPSPGGGGKRRHRNASGYLPCATEARCSSNGRTTEGTTSREGLQLASDSQSQRHPPQYVQHSVHAGSFFQQSQFFFTSARVLRRDLCSSQFPVLVPRAPLVNVQVRRGAWKVHVLLFPPETLIAKVQRIKRSTAKWRGHGRETDRIGILDVGC